MTRSWRSPWLGLRKSTPTALPSFPRRIGVECLEDRCAMTATPLTFGLFQTAQVQDFIGSTSEVDRFTVDLAANDSLQVAIQAKNNSSGLQAQLRLLDAAGNLQVADAPAGDPSLRFHASQAGTYTIEVSSRGNPGLYQLDARRTTAQAPAADLVASNFSTHATTALAGANVQLDGTIENRGNADPGNFRVEILLSTNNQFRAQPVVLATLDRAQLDADGDGRRLSFNGFAVALPADLAAGEWHLGVRIVADPGVPLADHPDGDTYRRGANEVALTVLALVPQGATDLSATAPHLNTRTIDALTVGNAKVYTFTVSETLGTGRFRADLASSSAGSNSRVRMTLLGPDGNVLMDTDRDHLDVHLNSGSYALVIVPLEGSGDFRLDTHFSPANAPGQNIFSGVGTASVQTADFNNDGIVDIVGMNRIDATVSIFLGLGDGTFRRAGDFPIGARAWTVSVGDVNLDGKMDVLTGNKGDNTVSVLLGHGDGTFVDQRVIPAGIRVGGALATDVNGDGLPDLVIDNYAEDTIYVVLGDGNGNFGPPDIYATDDNGNFQGPTRVRIADINGDGVPDMVYTTYVGANVVIRLGLGDGTFGAERKFLTGGGSYEPIVYDLNGDGHVDIVTVNTLDNNISVLFGKGDGTFQPQTKFATGADPYSMDLADFNGDGQPDFLTSNRNDNSISILLGNGDGSFQAKRDFATGKTPRHSYAGDFNGDGFVDVVTANQGEDTLGILLGRGDGTFAALAQSDPPAPSLRPFQIAVTDVNGDGRPDIVTANRGDNTASVLLSNPDGSFQTRVSFPVDRNPFGVTTGDLDGDGIPELLTANYGAGSITILRGQGDGTFHSRVDIPVGSSAYNVRVADINGDGKADVLVANKNDNNIGVLLGNGDGTLQPMLTFPVANGPFRMVVTDLNGDGIRDVVVSHFSATVVDVLIGNGDGTFQPTRQFDAGSRPYGIDVADLNGDGFPDIVTGNYRSGDLTLLFNNGDGTFRPPVLLPTGLAPVEVKTADLNGDGFIDLVNANYGGNSISVHLGNGDGTFRAPVVFAAGSGPASLAIHDMDGDGLLDVVVGSRNASSVQVLRGNGDGSFQAPVAFGGSANHYSVVVADLNGDGNPDQITASFRQDRVTVQLGDGAGGFAPGTSTTVGAGPTALAVADINRDGRLDLVTANGRGNNVSVLLGNGNGTFQAPLAFAVGRSPRAVRIADFNGDGHLDLATTNYQDNTATILLGRGDGTFFHHQTFATGAKPYGLVVGDFNGDGFRDLAIANSAANSATIVFGNGDGTFRPGTTLNTGRQPFALVAGDANGDGRDDLITADSFDNTVSFFQGNGDGTFHTRKTFAVGRRPYSVALTDVDGDGHQDLVVTEYQDGTASILLGDGAGNFAAPRAFAVGAQPTRSVVANVNNDSRPDLVTVSNRTNLTGVLLGASGGSFQPAATASVEPRNTAAVVDLDGDGVLDRLVLNGSGQILFRKGLGGATDAFAPPVVLNPNRPARDFTIVRTGNGLAVATADARADADLSLDQPVYTISLYQVSPQGVIARTVALATNAPPSGLLAADLNADGRDDLIAAHALDNTVSLALQTAPGVFGPPLTRAVGAAPADLAVADLNADQRLDVIVVHQASGDVAVLLNDAGHTFTDVARFRASTGIYDVTADSTSAAVRSAAQSVSVTVGDFTGDGLTDVLVVHRGEHRFVVLAGDGRGGLNDPQATLTTSTSNGPAINQRPGAIVAGDFNRDGKTDVALLMQDTGQLWIYTSNGDGTFRDSFRIPVGDQASGLRVVADAEGFLDLVVGNRFGDVLYLEGKGDGTFQIRGKRVSLSVIPNLLGDGQDGVLVGNQQDNRVTVQGRTDDGFSTVNTVGDGTQLAPGDVQWALLRGANQLPDAIVVGTGSNSVSVYRTLGVNQGAPVFSPTPQTFFVGTAPAGVTIADINGDNVPDLLVANVGSNDISLIFGAFLPDGSWTGTPGPRLRSGGNGPLAVTLRAAAPGGFPALVITNGGSGTMTELPGVGLGFFDDRDPRLLFDFGGALIQAPTFVGNSTRGYVVTTAGALVAFDLNDPAAGSRTVFTAPGLLAAQALTNGDVVVALESGAVKVLRPFGNQLVVIAELSAQGGGLIVPSSLVVVQREGGTFDVLVSSQGSDRIVAFSQAANPGVGSGGAGAAAGGGSLSAIGNSTGFASVLNNLSLGTRLSSTGDLGRSSGTSVSASGASSASAPAAVAPAGGSFGTGGAGGGGSDAATLVSTGRDGYSAVAVLGLDAAEDDESDAGADRMPELRSSRPIGDDSPRTREMMGLPEAIDAYLGQVQEHLDEWDNADPNATPAPDSDTASPNATKTSPMSPMSPISLTPSDLPVPQPPTKHESEIPPVVQANNSDADDFGNDSDDGHSLNQETVLLLATLLVKLGLSAALPQGNGSDQTITSLLYGSG